MILDQRHGHPQFCLRRGNFRGDYTKLEAYFIHTTFFFLVFNQIWGSQVSACDIPRDKARRRGACSHGCASLLSVKFSS